MLTSTLPRWEGDSEPRFVLDLARHLQSNFDVEIIAPHAQGAARSEVLEGVRISRYRYWWPRWQAVAYDGGIVSRLRNNPLRVFQVPSFFCALTWYVIRRLHKAPKVDLIHAHWLVPQGVLALLSKRLSRYSVPVVCTSHGGDLYGLQGPFWTRIKRWVLKQADAVTVVSEAMADEVRRIVPDTDPQVIPMGTDLANGFTPPLRARVEPLTRLLFVGRLVKNKGVEPLLYAMHRLVKSHPDLILTIVGHGPLRDPLEDMVDRLGLNGVVTFAGPVAHEFLAERYREADIAVFPSCMQEGFGLVLVEAMGCGCAVVASDLPAVRDIVTPGETGRLFSPGDHEALATTIESVLREPHETLAMAERGRQHALARFDWRNSGARFSAVYDEVIAGVIA